MAQSPTLEDVVRAQGVALALVGKLLERVGAAPPGEFGRLLALVASLTGETNDSQGVVMATWAALVLDSSDDRSEQYPSL